MTAPRPEHVVTGALSGRTDAYLAVTDAASRMDVELGALPGLLYKVSTPPDSGLTPVVRVRANEVRAGLRPAGGDGPDTVRIVLNRAVRWSISLPAGTGEEHLDLRGGQVSGLEFGACGLSDLRLPAPEGTVPVTYTAGVGQIAVMSPRAPARVVLAGGSGEVVTPWGARTATEPGGSVADPGWPRARDRYTITARGAAGDILLRQTE